MKKKIFCTAAAAICFILSTLFAAGCGMFGISCSPDKKNDGDPTSGKPEFASGDGTKSSPYVISADYQWLNVSKHPDSHFELAADINLGDFDGVSPTGTAEEPFTGTLDGKNHTISGGKIRSAHNTGLFGVMSGAEVKNLILANSTVTMLSDYNDGEFMGSFAAVARKGTILENCHTENVNVTFPSKTSYFTFVGGFVGSLESVSAAKYCSCDVKITLSSGKYPAFYVGGFAETVSGSVTDCCKTTGSITFGHPAGAYVMDVSAFVNRVINSKITNMFAEMNVSVGPTIDVYTMAGRVDEETLKYCLNFSTYQRATQGKYKSCKVMSSGSDYYNIYFPSSEYAYANDTLDDFLWLDNKFWKKGKVHPELVSYEEYSAIINGAE